MYCVAASLALGCLLGMLAHSDTPHACDAWNAWIVAMRTPSLHAWWHGARGQGCIQLYRTHQIEYKRINRGDAPESESSTRTHELSCCSCEPCVDVSNAIWYDYDKYGV